MIARLIKEFASQLQPMPSSLNPEALLWAVYNCEKYNASNVEPRFEPAYAPGGIYYDMTEHVREAWEKFGPDAACSYSNFQILYITAYELGYDGPPKSLDKDSFALPYVVLYINHRILEKGATTPEEVADAYNSGSFKDSSKPEGYMKRFRYFYDRALKRMETCPAESTSKPADSSTEPTSSPEE